MYAQSCPFTLEVRTGVVALKQVLKVWQKKLSPPGFVVTHFSILQRLSCVVFCVIAIGWAHQVS
jgi:hypothetical protein